MTTTKKYHVICVGNINSARFVLRTPLSYCAFFLQILVSDTPHFLYWVRQEGGASPSNAVLAALIPEGKCFIGRTCTSMSAGRAAGTNKVLSARDEHGAARLGRVYEGKLHVAFEGGEYVFHSFEILCQR